MDAVGGELPAIGRLAPRIFGLPTLVRHALGRALTDGLSLPLTHRRQDIKDYAPRRTRQSPSALLPTTAMLSLPRLPSVYDTHMTKTRRSTVNNVGGVTGGPAVTGGGCDLALLNPLSPLP